MRDSADFDHRHAAEEPLAVVLRQPVGDHSAEHNSAGEVSIDLAD